MNDLQRILHNELRRDDDFIRAERWDAEFGAHLNGILPDLVRPDARRVGVLRVLVTVPIAAGINTAAMFAEQIGSQGQVCVCLTPDTRLTGQAELIQVESVDFWGNDSARAAIWLQFDFHEEPTTETVPA